MLYGNSEYINMMYYGSITSGSGTGSTDDNNNIYDDNNNNNNNNWYFFQQNYKPTNCDTNQSYYHN